MIRWLNLKGPTFKTEMDRQAGSYALERVDNGTENES